jgi:hypothetical protein
MRCCLRREISASRALIVMPAFTACTAPTNSWLADCSPDAAGGVDWSCSRVRLRLRRSLRLAAVPKVPLAFGPAASPSAPPLSLVSAAAGFFRSRPSTVLLFVSLRMASGEDETATLGNAAADDVGTIEAEPSYHMRV